MKRFFIVLALFCLAAIPAVGQYYHTQFGHNRIQYKNFEWYYYTTNNFEVYYYPGGQDYALHALNFLEEEFTELTDVLGYAPYTRTKIFIYNSIQELQQSNIGISGDVYTIGGKTDFVKLQVEIPYTGQTSEFKKEMLNKLSRVLINDMMFGGSLAEIFQNSYLLSLPDWFVDGAARYLAYGWSQEMDDYVRDYLDRKNINKLVKIQNDEAEIVGQSIWNYIAIKYGRSNISNILNLTRIIRNEENSISSTLGISFKQFLTDWQNFYLIQQNEIRENYKQVDDTRELASYGRKIVSINHVEINAAGDKVAYTSHRNGKYKVNVVDLNNGREKTIVNGGYLLNQQDIEDFRLPLIDWQDNNTLGVILYKRGHLYLNTYNLNNGSKLQKPLNRFRQVESFAFNDNGRLAILSGDIDGQNDLFLISMRRNALKRVTNDLYDDIDPTFIPGSAAVVFSSNRAIDSVEVETVQLEAIGDNYNLFLYDLDTTTYKFHRLTNTYSIDRKPNVKNQNSIYYLSDQRGITNLYRYNLLDGTFTQASNFEYSIEEFDISTDSKMVYLMLDEGRNKVFLDPSFDLDQKIFTPETARRRMAQAQMLVGRLNSNRQRQDTFSTKVEIPAPEPVTTDLNDVDSLVMPDSFFFTEEDEEAQTEVSESEAFIDTDNYTFEDDQTTSNRFRPESFFSNYRKLERKSTVIGPQAYEPRFSFNNLITSFAIDPWRGFSLLLETEVDDILENHRLIGGVLTDMDFKSGNIYGEYQFLKYWMDFHLRFNHNVYNIDLSRFQEKEGMVQRYSLNRIEIAASVPLTNSFRFELSPFWVNTSFSNLQSEYVLDLPATSGFADDSETHFGGLRAAAVFDNTLEKGFNIYQGTRGIVKFESYLGVNNPNRSFNRLDVDLRHYQKIHKEITLAGRLFYGSSFGNNAQNYALGGMQNWIFRQFEDQGVSDPFYFDNTRDNSNFLFTEYVTNLRGFNYNELFGTEALLFNAELRFPVFRYFSSAPISSAFLRNFQLIGFYDMGTAWTGKPPFTKNGNTFRKKYVTTGGNGAFSAEISNFQNPWLAGYGFGVRTVLLGYYLKLDVARPIQDFEVGDTRFYLTMGLDF